MFLQARGLGRQKLSGNLVVPNLENVNNQHHDIALGKLRYCEQSLLYCLRACEFAPNQIARIFSVFWYIIIADISWEAVLQNKNTNSAMDTYYQHLLTAYTKSFPFVKLSGKQAKDKPW